VKTDIDNLRNALDSSPRKYKNQLHDTGLKKMGSNMSFAVSIAGINNAAPSPFEHIDYNTPPPQNTTQGPARTYGENVEPNREPLRRMQSAESLQPMKSFDAARLKRGPGTQTTNKGPYNFTVVQHRIEPHTLGLSTNPQAHTEGVSEPIARPGSGLSFREKMDRNRFEFKAVRRKASGSIKYRGANLWDQVRNRAKVREGWI
jgi:hypothetical protein